MSRPNHKPTYRIGPVSVWVRLHEDTGDPVAAEAWVGTFCVAEYGCDEVCVSTVEDPEKNVVAEFKDGNAAVEWMDDRIRDWLGGEDE